MNHFFSYVCCWYYLLVQNLLFTCVFIRSSPSQLLYVPAVVWRCSVKNMFLRISQDSQENTCARVSFLVRPKTYNFIKKETLAQVLSCVCWEIFKNTFFYRKPPVAASLYEITILKNFVSQENTCDQENAFSSNVVDP